MTVSRQRKHQLRHPDRTKARSAVTQACASGKLVRPAACGCCGAPCQPEAHHVDYSKPLEVEWLCRRCHRWAHSRHEARRRTVVAPPPPPRPLVAKTDTRPPLTMQQLGGLARAARIRELKALEAAGDPAATRCLRKIRRAARANGKRPKRAKETQP